MSGFEIGLIGFAALIFMLAIRIPIGVAMLATGMIGYASIAGVNPLFSFLKTQMYWQFTSFDLSVAPLFILVRW